ncbi:DUF421 domain-containing protein [Ciceribacter ferrooxidans]|nr:DUF421 domain-containing protein [Ciceribacter ferrooxidans]
MACLLRATTAGTGKGSPGQQQGITSLDQIRFAILEASGWISVIPKK